MHLFAVAVAVASLFNAKAKALWTGQGEAVVRLRSTLSARKAGSGKTIWVHAASLGEFEQGRPVIERLRKQYADCFIVLTFFSPSGYEVRHNYQGADAVLYLPLDTRNRVRAFLDELRPDIAIIVKYEFWLNYLAELKKRNIITYIISAIFRPNQVFFKWYGGMFRCALTTFRTLFVQDEQSQKLLSGIGVNNVIVAGDTRFDRVMDIANAAKQLPIVEAFADGAEVLVIGSSWEADEMVYADYINRNRGRIKTIIAPHVVSEERVRQIISRLNVKCCRYTQTTPDEARSCDCLIVDTMGLLSSIYRYGKVAYVGGGFGVAVHNTLEAAVWGMPVVFGPAYHKFKEACELIECGAARSVNSKRECDEALDRFFANHAGPAKAAHDYVASRIGATDKIMTQCFN